ncbi:MAG TPA: hypothetical protein VMT63_14505 [Bacteroidales bacterium]|nr:hypothetical protein [Bacteroidales bacterium]
MVLTNAKHIITEIDGTRCTVVETGASIERAAFLRDLLEFNKLEVKELKEPQAAEGPGDNYTIGVTDLSFNPVFAVYECQLKTKEGGYVTPGYWRQECVDCDNRYWIKRKIVKKPSEPNEVLQ